MICPGCSVHDGRVRDATRIRRLLRRRDQGLDIVPRIGCLATHRRHELHLKND